MPAPEGLNEVNISERELKEPIRDESKPLTSMWYRNPGLLQTFILGFAVLCGIFMFYDKIYTGFGIWAMNMTGMQIGTLFITSFTVMLVFMAYFILVTYLTGNITNKLLFAKLMRKRILLHKGDDNILSYYIPKTREGFWEVSGVGLFKTKKNAMLWLSNGQLAMITTEGHAEGIDLDGVKENELRLTDNKAYEDRIKAAVLEAKEEQNKIFNPQVVAWIIMALLIVGIVGYLLIGASQQGTCQAKLVEIAGKCGQIAQEAIKQANQTSASESFIGIPTAGLPKMI